MNIFKTHIILLLMILFVLSCNKNKAVSSSSPSDTSAVLKDGQVTIYPDEYYNAIRNPMKGLREFFSPGIDPVRKEYPYPYSTLIKEYMPWNKLENKASDGVDKIIAYSNHMWKGVEDMNMKVIPRPYIVWMAPWYGGKPVNTYTDSPDDIRGMHWPSDIPPVSRADNDTTSSTGGYFYPTFQDRVKAFVAKLGEAWDNDPRVAYVEMGIIGQWGEQHDPDISTYWPPADQLHHVANRTWVPGIEKVLADAFKKAFKHKKVMVRYAYDFKDYNFGIFWDSWAQPQEKVRGYEAMLKRGNYWKTQPVGGEITWNWGDLAKFNSFEEVVGDPKTRERVIEQIRNLHANHLGGITWANFKDPSFIPNARLLQKALGYRYVLKSFSYPSEIKINESFKISFKIKNTGSSPFYYNWPVEIALLDSQTHVKVWSTILSGVNISGWMPGENWNTEKNEYLKPPQEYDIEKVINVDKNVPKGKYIISMAILDPAGMLPSLRLAIVNYFKGGRHPIGYIGVNEGISSYKIPSNEFMDLSKDLTLHYKLK